MFRQAFSSSSRALRSAPRIAATKPFARPQFVSAPAFRSRAAQPVSSRWYSDAKEAEAEAAKPAEEAKSEEKQGNGEQDPVVELKKQLEAKDTEARDWKVRIGSAPHHMHVHLY